MAQQGEVELADEDEMIRKGTRHRRPEKEKEAKEKSASFNHHDYDLADFC